MNAARVPAVALNFYVENPSVHLHSDSQRHLPFNGRGAWRGVRNSWVRAGLASVLAVLVGVALAGPAYAQAFNLAMSGPVPGHSGSGIASGTAELLPLSLRKITWEGTIDDRCAADGVTGDGVGMRFQLRARLRDGSLRVWPNVMEDRRGCTAAPKQVPEAQQPPDEYFASGDIDRFRGVLLGLEGDTPTYEIAFGDWKESPYCC